MIFCVEDDNSIRAIEVYTLQSMGFEALPIENGKDLDEALKTEIPQLIILDIMLPGEDGVNILKRLREDKRTANVPVIMATAKGSEFDKIESLDLGADDYLVKPFGMMEMVSRVKAVLRRSEGVVHTEPKNIYTVSGIVMNTEEHEVLVDGKRVGLTLKEYEILKTFILHRGVVFSRDNLFKDIWGYDFVGESRTVDMHIKSLRHKLGEYAYLIETVRGLGYKLGKGNG